MITLGSTPADDILEVRISGTVTAGDYETVLVPAVEAALEARERLRLLAVFDGDFRHYTAGAMAEDARLGLRHWHGFGKVAVVAGNLWLKTAIALFAPVMPCPIRVFPVGTESEARDWLRAE
ncbi:STAS/SEC14 domain-containing protein [Poseidonocella sp. HB161398]|uniref:STAS/SEC14 domain-containing protein n=1 Tax=Poseidonocella sp. HB161398 TaxID=2320855 RepID=UPI0011087E96|nr:STAS/SEC14 domain-containing protein [Poseidonocella sp. HB161398]